MEEVPEGEEYSVLVGQKPDDALVFLLWQRPAECHLLEEESEGGEVEEEGGRSLLDLSLCRR